MTAPSAAIVQKLWNYCNILRDDGLSYGDYTEQLTFLLFLKMAHERTQPPWKDEPIVPAKYGWPALVAKDGDALEIRWRAYAYDELVARDKASLDIFWLRDESLADSTNLPAPDVIAEEIVEDLRAALVQFEELWTGLGSGVGKEPLAASG